MIADWPLVDNPVAATALGSFSIIQDIVVAVRRVRKEYNVELSQKIGCSIRFSNAHQQLAGNISRERQMIAFLARVDDSKLTFDAAGAPTATDDVHIIIRDGIEVFVPMNNLIDTKKEILRLEKQRDNLIKYVDSVTKKLSGMSAKAPKEVVEETRRNLNTKQDELVAVEKSLAKLIQPN